MKFNVLNNEPLQFFNESGDLIGTILISGSGDMVLRPESGSSRDIILGNQDTVGDVEIGLPSAEANLKLMGGGTISANGNTLTIGDATAGDQLIFAVPITASNVQTASFAVSASHLIGGGGGGSSFTAQGISGSFGAPSASFSTRVTSLESSGGGGSGIFSTVNGFKVTNNNLIISKSSAGALTSSLSVQGSGSGIFNVQGDVGQLFEVQDGLDGVLMSVNDISGIPILTVSSSGNVILAQGSNLIGTASVALNVPGATSAFPFTGNARITGELDITGSGDDIFKVRSQSGSLFSVDDGLDGVLMSVNDISGLPIFEVSSSELITFTGNITGSSTTTASFGHLIVNGTSISGSATGGGGSSFTAEMISGSFGAPSASFSTRVTSLESGTGTTAGTVSSSAQITSLGFVTSSATASFITSSATGSFNNLIITNFSGSLVPGDGSTISYPVTVVNSGGDKFAIDVGSGVQTTPAFSLLAGNTYRFTQDDNSNNNHPFGFANFSDDSAYTDGVTYNGTAGQAGSYAQIVVTNSTPKLKYRCTVHGVGMGDNAAVTITTGSLIQNGFLEVSGSTRLSGSLVVNDQISSSFINIGKEQGVVLGINAVNNRTDSTGLSNIVIGQDADSGNVNSYDNISIGRGSTIDTSNGAGAISIGPSSQGGNNSVNIGFYSKASYDDVSIGRNAGSKTNSQKINIGRDARGTGTKSITFSSISSTAVAPTKANTFGIYMTNSSPNFEIEATGSSTLSGSSFTIEKSGSTVFEVIGSEGTLFSLDDDLDGTLFTVNDRSGIPQFEVSSSGLVEVGEGPLKLKGNNIQDESFTWFMA